jgi:hypothetical protein
MSAPRGRRLHVVGLLVAVVLLPLPTISLAPVARGALDLLPPIGVADTLTMLHDTVAVVPPPGVLGNDVDLDGGATAVLDSPPSHGTVNLRSDGGYTYKPNAGYVGTDEFWYHATSNLLNSLTTPVTITITNVPPVAVDDAYSGTTGKPLVVPAPGVLKNDIDADGDPLRAELRGGISPGSIDLDPDGGFTYDPGGGDFTGVTTFNYRIWDGAAWSLEATVAITMLPEPTPLPSLDPTPLPSILPTPLPSILPTPTPTPTPRPTPTPTARPTPTPTTTATPTSTPTPSPITTDARPSPSSSPVPAGPGSPGGPDGGAPSPTDDAFALPPVQIDPFDDRLSGFDAFGGFEWAVPAIVLAVPGLLLIVALLAQAAIGVVWLPMVRRHLAGVGLRRRRREPVRS